MRYLPLAVLLSACVASAGARATETVSILRSTTETWGCASAATGGCETRKVYFLETATGKRCRVSEKEYWLAKRDSAFTCVWKWSE